MHTTKPPARLYSVGHVCQRLQTPLDRLLATMREIGVEPVEYRNDVAFVDADGLNRLSEASATSAPQGRRKAPRASHRT